MVLALFTPTVVAITNFPVHRRTLIGRGPAVGRTLFSKAFVV
jgi:hypothetical protein